MTSSWPEGVTTQEDMYLYAETLFGDCEIENLLTGTQVDGDPGCFLIRVKGACNQGNWNEWPKLTDEAMKATVETYGRPDIIQVKSKVAGAPRARLYDTMQVTPNTCTCRAYFGGDRHHKLQTSSSATTATQTMGKMLRALFKPTTEQWNETQPSYHGKACHLVLNKYQRNDGIDPHKDLSPTYSEKNPITSFSYGRGSILTITDSNKPTKQRTALYYQFPGDAIIMSGEFNMAFYHGVPAVDSWQELFKRQNSVRELPQNEMQEADRVIKGEGNERFNVTIRWHEQHYDGCPYRCGTAAQIAVPQAPARPIHKPGSAPVKQMPEIAAVNKIVGPVNEKAVETHRVDTEQTIVTKAALFRLFADVASGVPDWMGICAALPLLPSRASENHDYEILKALRDKQARYLNQLATIKESYFDVATELDLAAVKQTLQRESRKLGLLECRLEIYTTILDQVAHVPFNEVRLATDHTSKNDTKVIRAIVTFKQAGLLVDGVSWTHIANANKLIVGISKISPWNDSEKCFLTRDVFRSGTMEAEKRQFRRRYAQIKYFEASWPEARVAHRIQPLHGSMHAHTKKRHRSDDEDQQQVHDDVQQRSENYAFMLQNLMVMIQDYLVLSDDNEQRGALKSLDLVGGTAQLNENNRICIWLEDCRGSL